MPKGYYEKSPRNGPSEVTKATSDEARPIKLPRHL